MKQKKFKLLDERPLTVIGIVSPETDIKLSWAINQMLKVQLTRIESVITDNKSGLVNSFSLFFCDDEDSMLKFSMVCNRPAPYRLFDMLKNIDFLLFVRGLDSTAKPEMIAKVRKLPEISSCIEVDASLIKNKELLELF